MTTPSPESIAQNARLQEYATESVRAEIVSNLGKLATGYFTSEELAQAEVTAALSGPDTPTFPDETLTIEEILQILTNMDDRTAEEDLEDQIEELENSGSNLDCAYFESERLGAAEQALIDYKDINIFMATGMSQAEALAELLKFRQSDIEFMVIYWRSGYEALKNNGFAVPATVEEWAKPKL